MVSYNLQTIWNKTNTKHTENYSSIKLHQSFGYPSSLFLNALSLRKPSPGYTSSIHSLPICFFFLVLYLLYICIYICNNCMFLHTRILLLLLFIHVFLPVLLLSPYSPYSPQPPYCLHICIFFKNFLDPQIHSVCRLTFLLPVLQQALYTTLSSIFHTTHISSPLPWTKTRYDMQKYTI